MTTWLTVDTINEHLKDPLMLNEPVRTTKEVFDMFESHPRPMPCKDGFILKAIHSYKAQGAVHSMFTKTFGAHYHSFILIPYTANQCVMCEE